MLEEVSIVLGVASREVVQFGALDELLARVGARRLEQTIVHDRAADIRRHERLAHQVRDRIGDLRRGDVDARRDGAGGVQREGPDEHPQPAQDHPLGFG